MTVLKTAVFLASRFDEFEALRVELRRKISEYPIVDFTPIDLNDGRVSHRPPLEECVANVRRSEFMILLMGDTYGAFAPKHNKSFTHLEYLEAIREGSNTRVLVFCIGNSYKGRQIAYSKMAVMAAWQRQLQARHTLGFIDPKVDTKKMAEEVFLRLLEALYDLRFGQVSVAYDEEYGDALDLLDSIPESIVLDDTEVAYLTEINANAKGLNLTDEADKYRTTIDMLMHPNAIAALEHQREANVAIELADYAVAISHLKRALKLKPLDLMSNYWLARLYVALEYKHKYNEIIELLERAIRISKWEQADVRISASYQIAARAAIMVDRLEEAENYAQASIDAAGFYSRSFIEMARVQVLQGKKKQAVSNIQKAYERYSPSLHEVIGNPIFKPMRSEIDALLLNIKGHLRKSIKALHTVEKKLCLMCEQECNTEEEIKERTIPKLIQLARISIQNQHGHAVNIITKCKKYWEREIIEENWDNVKITTAHFEFSRSGTVTVTEWFKVPGDSVKPKEGVFQFEFEGNPETYTWTWRGDEIINIEEIFKSDHTVFNQDNTALFDFRLADAEPQRINKLSYAKAQLEEAGTRKEQVNRELVELEQLLQKLRVKARLEKLGLFAMVVLSIALIDFDLVSWGVGVFALAVYLFFSIVNGARWTKHSEIKPVRSVIRQYRCEIDKLDEKLLSLPGRIEGFNAIEKDLQSRTKCAIELFNGCLAHNAQWVPFGNLPTAKADSIVRTSSKNIERYQSKFGRKVDIDDDVPPYLEHLHVLVERHNFLAKVKTVTPDRIVISVTEAYIDGVHRVGPL